jgi:predicted DNA-binding transcriptional regulator YafY
VQTMISEDEKIPRLSRLTAILIKLQAKPFVSVKELAAYFQVSKRTIYRDILALEASGVPIVTEENKGFSVMEGYNIPPMMFSEGEANALVLAGKMIEKTLDSSLITDFNAAMDKIKSVLLFAEKQKSDLLGARIIIGKNWHFERNSKYLSSIQSALTNFNVLRIGYLKEGDSQPIQREIEPFAIYHNPDEKWVVIAWCRLRGDFRSFRVDRIQQLEMLKAHFPPHTLSLDEYVDIQRKKHFGEL